MSPGGRQTDPGDSVRRWRCFVDPELKPLTISRLFFRRLVATSSSRGGVSHLAAKRGKDGARHGTVIGVLAAQEVFGFLDEDIAADVGDCVGERDLFGAGFYTVLRKTAFLNSAVAG